MSVSRHHADWLSLVESSGPFLSLPVLLRSFPQGLDPRDPEQAKQLRLAYEEWQENPTPAARQRGWIIYVLTQTLGYPRDLLVEGQSIPPGLSATMAEYGETLRPDFVLLGPPGSELACKPQLLISIYPSEQSLEKPLSGKHWKATPATRMMELLHAADVPLGLVTNGEQWMLVFAPRGETTGFTSWYAALWIDEPITLRSFQSLFCARRFFGVAGSDTLQALLKESAQDQEEVTNQLGDQVRDAVEVLIQAFDRLDQESGRTLLTGADEKSLYDAALTVMMRLVFLFSAEERGLLHLGKPMYDDNYAVSTLREQLQEVADRHGEEVLERRQDAWARLLATFRAVHGGVSHQDLMLPAYGGSLFEPDRYPFLEGRPQGSHWISKPAEPLAINNRVVLHLLNSLQMLQIKVPGGGPAEARRISFRALDIEQIGHIYEGLLDHTAVRAREIVLGLAASRKKPVASITLSELETLRQKGEAKLIETLQEVTERSAKALEKALRNADAAEDFHRVLIACGQDQKVAERVRPFIGLVRQDSFERPVIVLPGGISVGQGAARRSTGTHYTPRSLTEPIVQHTLEPVVYIGPAEGLPKEQWRLKSPKEILDLKICDMTMGSGAFLVQVCRYLSERLVEAWENLEKEYPGEVLITPEGEFSHSETRERLIPKEASERVAIARRLVADRCVHGVDINPMAVEMAKLSIWLITVDKTRPFTFLDHALKCGDSLLGVSSLEQIKIFSVRPGKWQVTFATANLFRCLHDAAGKRSALEHVPSDNPAQIETKHRLHAEAEIATLKVKGLAEVLIAFELRSLAGDSYERERTIAAEEAQEAMRKPVAEFQNFAREQLAGYRTFHWPVEFPEVFEKGGFHCFVGNPPFLGGKRISTVLGITYNNFLKAAFSDSKGAADLCAYFYRRAHTLSRNGGTAGLLATNTIAQADTREVGLDVMLRAGARIYHVEPSVVWPGTANVHVSIVHWRNGEWKSQCLLGTKVCDRISSGFDARDIVSIKPARIRTFADAASSGVGLMGMGFVVESDLAAAWIQTDSKYKDILWPYMNGQEFNNTPDFSAKRYAINFCDMAESEAARYPLALARLRELVKPDRDRLKGQIHESCYWKYWDRRDLLYRAVEPLSRVLVCAMVTKHLSFAFLPKDWVYSQKLIVFPSDKAEHFAVLQCTFHEAWVRFQSPTLKSDLSYSVSDAFRTFAAPDPLKHKALASVGAIYHEHRQSIMRTRREGLTATYNHFHDPGEESEDMCNLRRMQLEMDQAVAATYGWSDLDLDHGFYHTMQGARFTISESARRAVLDRLLTLNHQRYEEECKAGLNESNKRGRKRGDSRKPHGLANATQSSMYD